MNPNNLRENSEKGQINDKINYKFEHLYLYSKNIR